MADNEAENRFLFKAKQVKRQMNMLLVFLERIFCILRHNCVGAQWSEIPVITMGVITNTQTSEWARYDEGSLWEFEVFRNLRGNRNRTCHIAFLKNDNIPDLKKLKKICYGDIPRKKTPRDFFVEMVYFCLHI